MTFFTSYLTTIAGFLIFMAFAQLIIPNESSKKYINFIIGLIFIVIIINPIGNLIFGAGFGQFNLNSQLAFSETMLRNQTDLYNAEQLNLIIATYKDQLEAQIRQKTETIAAVYTVRINIDENPQSAYFGRIENISLTIGEAPAPPRAFIRVEPVEVLVGRTANQPTESLEAKNIKNLLSSFYNLSVDNIHIKTSNRAYSNCAFSIE